MTRVLLVDDSATFAASAAQYLGALQGVQVVGAAANGLEALSKVEALRPDFVLMDMDMPVMGGLEAGRLIASQFPLIKTVYLSAHDGLDYQDLARRAGGFAFVTKSDFVARITGLLMGSQRWAQSTGGVHLG